MLTDRHTRIATAQNSEKENNRETTAFTLNECTCHCIPERNANGLLQYNTDETRKDQLYRMNTTQRRQSLPPLPRHRFPHPVPKTATAKVGVTPTTTIKFISVVCHLLKAQSYFLPFKTKI